MRAQSDMKTIIKVAEYYLDMEVKIIPDSGNTYKHPFLISAFLPIPESEEFQSLIPDNMPTHSPFGDGRKFIFIGESPETMEAAREIKRVQLHKCKSPFEVFFLMDKPYRLYFFSDVRNCLSANDYSEILRFVWVGSENTNHTRAFTKKELKEIFAAAVPEHLMNADELEIFHNLPEELTIYRGMPYRRKNNVRVFSWTLSIDCAEEFSSRFCSKEGAIYQANIDKNHIFAYFSGEEEIIVNPYKLKNITELNTADT